MTLLLYMSVYLPYIVRIREESEEHSPQVVPLLTLFLLITFLTSIMGLWPVWGWFTVPIIVVIATGVWKVHHFLPSNAVGMIIHFAIMFAAFASPKWINHTGHWHNLF